MARRGYIPKRKLKPDTKYNNVVVAEFINRVMRAGKKSTATTVVYDALEMVADRMKKDPIEVFDAAMTNVTPVLEVKPRRVGGATYQVPVEVPPERRMSLAMRWLLAAAQARPGKSMPEKLAAELMDAANNTGAAVKRRDETHRMAEANRAFAHYRW